MELKIEDILPNHNVRGIIHIGGHHGQEWSVYYKYKVPVIFIEPCSRAFKILEEKFAGNEMITLFNYAMGSEEFKTEMYIEKTYNLGASNSVLKPKIHLEQYPEIQFTEREEVLVRTLDSLPFDKSQYNILVIDTQGYELEVLKGAKETLKNIDCIYTEVNREEMYEDCAMVSEVDEYLKDFTRTSADWRGGRWGDAVYVKKYERQIVVVSCDKYRKCWNPIYKLIKKYITLDWSITLITDGVDGEPFEEVKGGQGKDYGWIENLKRGLEGMEGVILFLQEDFFPASSWDTDFIEKCVDLMQVEDIGCFRLYPCPGASDEIGQINGITYGEISKGEPYRVSCQVALWDVEYLKSILNEVSGTAANFEISGSNVDVPGKVFSVLRQSPTWPVAYICTGIVRGKWNPNSFKLFKKEGITVNYGIYI